MNWIRPLMNSLGVPAEIVPFILLGRFLEQLRLG